MGLWPHTAAVGSPALQAGLLSADNHLMRTFPFGRLGRGLAAAVIGALVAFAPIAASAWLESFSASAEPRTAGELASWLASSLGVYAVLHVFWLLPACVVTQLLLTRDRDHGMRVAVRGATIVSLVALAAQVPLLAMIFRSLSLQVSVAWVPYSVAGLLFVWAWFVSFNLLGSRLPHAARVPSVQAVQAGHAAGNRHIGRWALALAVAGWTLGCGFLYSTFTGICFDQRERQSSVASPNHDWRADIVIDYEGGGPLTGTASEVYVLPASESWSPTHRGLLIWRAKRVRVETVMWESDRRLRVRAKPKEYQTPFDVLRRSQAFNRNGFVAVTEVSTER